MFSWVEQGFRIRAFGRVSRAALAAAIFGRAAPPTVGRTSWSTPKNLPVGTHTYFCRIHPLMRGAFRVVKD